MSLPHQSQTEAEMAQAATAEQFYSGALHRIGYFMAALALLLAAVAWWRFGLRPTVGFGFGCGIAYLNFHWLKRVIAGFVDRATGAATSQSGTGIVFRFLLRYILMALGAYVILTVSPASLNGLLAGLFLPVAAIICEALYELYAALVRGV
ncbi:MAG TPA: ATP synthase subunit I [Candidatus Eremiobacteraceae bacterium]|nr:ATP synthase subunit I [Candidatus Eremiobacteraceae bacterium]